MQCQLLDRAHVDDLLVPSLRLEQQLQRHVVAVFAEVALLKLLELLVLVILKFFLKRLVAEVALAQLLEDAKDALMGHTHASHAENRQKLIFHDELLEHRMVAIVDSVHAAAFFRPQRQLLQTLVVLKGLEHLVETFGL